VRALASGSRHSVPAGAEILGAPNVISDALNTEGVAAALLDRDWVGLLDRSADSAIATELFEAVRDKPARSVVLLNRCITRAHSTANAREALAGLGYDVLRTAVPRLEVYAQSFGLPISEIGRDVWRGVAGDLIERCVPLGKVQL